MSEHWFKNFKKHFNLHNVKLIGKEASLEYITEKVFPPRQKHKEKSHRQNKF